MFNSIEFLRWIYVVRAFPGYKNNVNFTLDWSTLSHYFHSFFNRHLSTWILFVFLLPFLLYLHLLFFASFMSKFDFILKFSESLRQFFFIQMPCCGCRKKKRKQQQNPEEPVAANNPRPRKNQQNTPHSPTKELTPVETNVSIDFSLQFLLSSFHCGFYRLTITKAQLKWQLLSH